MARQYSGTQGKTGNCQIAVSVHLANEHASCAADWRLFCPQSWDDAVAGNGGGRPPQNDVPQALSEKFRKISDLVSAVRTCGRGNAGPVRRGGAVLPGDKAAVGEAAARGDRGDGLAATGKPRRTTLAAIAAEAGVSLPTVSKVVNGRRDVAPATRALVERLLDEQHYTRAGTRRRRRSGLVDLVFNGLDSPWAVEILRGIEEWGTLHSTAVAVSAVRHGNARPASWTSGLVSHDTDGVILVTSELTGSQLGQLREADVPLVVLDPGNPPPPDLPSVGATNWAGGLAATEHLLGLGHRRIGVIAGPGEYLCSRARTDGCRSALERAGIRFDPALVRSGDFQHEGGFVRGGELLSLPEPPTAIFAGSDQQPS